MKKITYLFVFCITLVSIFLLGIPSVYAQEKIEITNIEVKDKSSTLIVEDLSYSNNTISSSLVFNTINDFIILKIELANNGTNDYKLESITNQLNNDNLNVESLSNGRVIKKGDKEWFEVKLKYTNELLNIDELTPINSSLSFNFVDANILINPATSNKTILSVIAVLFMAITFTYLVKTNKIKLAVLLLILSVPTMVIAEEGFSINLKLENIVIKGRITNYNVTTNNVDGSSSTVIKSYGETVGELPEVNEQGYNFNGWIDQNNNDVTETTIVKEDLTLTPKIEPIEYKIDYDLDGGNLSKDNKKTSTVEDEFTLNNPEKEGYTFAGWTSDGITYQTKVTIEKGSIGNKEFKATYSNNEETTYTVIHNKMDMNGEYKESEKETLKAPIDAVITPETKVYEGFISPIRETKTIEKDNTVFIYNYEREKYHFSITDRTNIETTTVDGNYYYGTKIELKAKSKDGYAFSWSDGDTNLEKTLVLKSNKELTPIYTPYNNIPYKVIHKKMNIDGKTYTTENEEVFYGTTDTEVEPAVNNYEGFISPTKQKAIIKPDKSTVVEYLYERNICSLLLKDNENIETNTPTDDYYYGTSISLKAKRLTGYEFDHWSDGHISNPYIFDLDKDTTIKPVYKKIENNINIINFNSNGGKEISDVYNVEKGNMIGSLPIPTKDNYVFMGWYSSLENGLLIDEDYIPTTNMTLYAYWKKIDPLCIKATELHTESCDRTSEGCFIKGNSTITYGNIPNGNLELGDAYICDINGDGKYNEKSERFYYLRNNGNNAVLVFFTNFEGINGPDKNKDYSYEEGKKMLPTIKQWVTIKKSTRYPTLKDLEKCNNNNKLDICEFLFENSNYSNNNIGKESFWLEKDNSKNYNVNNKDNNINKVKENTKSAVRPVIEIPLSQIEHNGFVITFNSNGGSTVDSISVMNNEPIGIIPIPQKSNLKFDGWYKDETYKTRITENTIIDDNIVLYAKWSK